MAAPATAPDLDTYVSDRVRETPPSGIRRFFDIAATMDNVISLGIGEPDFNSPDAALEAGVDALENGRTSYTCNDGMEELRELITEDYEERYGLSYDPKSEIVAMGR